MNNIHHGDTEVTETDLKLVFKINKFDGSLFISSKIFPCVLRVSAVKGFG